MADFKKLEVWRKGHALALLAHQVALTIRGSQYASLRSQIIRASMSIPANIVEGREQKTDAGFTRFLRYALASASELEYHVIIARDTAVISEEHFVSTIDQLKSVRMMLFALIKRLDPHPVTNSEAIRSRSE
ncbi:MAG: four helix bundle protein [Gemmatimonadaceae bacterium]